MNLGDLERLYSEVTKVKFRLESAVSVLEFGTSSEARNLNIKNDITTAKQQQLSGLANQLSRYVEEMKVLYGKLRLTLHQQQQSTWDWRLEKVENDSKLLVLSVDKALGYMSIRREAELDRERLLENSQARRRDRV
eukprot:Gregarina_sp_Poly_1__3827@NODE_213_length_11325_cov_357_800853_g189_i0_p4_GENE_NODE_213_length_11325_cov_357_800853_g189_i0NODE_213_length_11325_cov_357_800853_g189_i0_p4_ORF_typecomplete_len136_score10_58_NODE_213_length_11325_cov_357_800853_g189_i095809987